jgi:hypothetical protein
LGLGGVAIGHDHGAGRWRRSGVRLSRYGTPSEETGAERLQETGQQCAEIDKNLR